MKVLSVEGITHALDMGSELYVLSATKGKFGLEGCNSPSLCSTMQSLHSEFWGTQCNRARGNVSPGALQVAPLALRGSKPDSAGFSAVASDAEMQAAKRRGLSQVTLALCATLPTEGETHKLGDTTSRISVHVKR